MCGRFTQAYSWDEVFHFLGLIGAPQNLMPRYNIAPTQNASVVRAGPSGRAMSDMRWGLIPFWAEDLKIGAKTINARAESVAEKPAFREAYRARRCLVPADGFYEWRTVGGRKQPFRVVSAAGPLFAFAGLWERWRHGPDGPIESFTIITTEANARLAPIHPRMPVILDPRDFDAWLDPDHPVNEGGALLKSAPSEAVEAYPVSPRVNNVKNDDEECIKPAPDQPDLL